MLCEAAVLLWTPRTSVSGKSGVARCSLDLEHDGPHQSTHIDEEGMPWPTKVVWDEEDRRTFRGELVLCPHQHCVCPAGHRGNHAWW